MNSVSKTTRINDNIMHNDKDAIDKLDKTVTTVVKLLMLSNKTIATAESCTGGFLSELITNIPGASNVFEAGVCSYSNRIKHEILGVPQDVLDRFTEISSQTAIAMADGIKKLSGADICVSVTGLAGPGGGTEEKPVGTVYAGFVFNNQRYARLFDFSGRNFDRKTIREYTALSIFEEVKQLLEGDGCDE